MVKLQVKEGKPIVSRLRCVSSQIIACSSSFLLLFDLGMATNFSTIIMPELIGSKGRLCLDETQASWFGSLSFLAQPVGALVSGPIVDFIGRKKANFLVNIPMILAWLLMYFAWNLTSLFIANALLGISSGMMEAPANSYVSEISEPSIRGTLCVFTQFFAALGIPVIYFLGTVMEWWNAALLCVIAPVLSMISVIFTPETPVWLLTRNREKEALESLCTLRGWTTPDNVAKEFSELSDYSKKLQQCGICSSTDKNDQICPHQSNNWFMRRIIKFRYIIICKETLRPLTLVVMYFLFFIMSDLTPIKPNLVNICRALGMAQDSKQVVVIVGVITLIVCFLTIGLIKVLGKRKLVLSSMFGSGICYCLLSIYAGKILDSSVSSYHPETFPKETSVIPLILLYLLTIFTGMAIPFVLLAELFSFRSRAMAQGIAAASFYIFAFLGSKTFINLESSVKLSGTFATYAGFGVIGTLYLYFFLPETEGKSLQEIEAYYSGPFRIFADDPLYNKLQKMIKEYNFVSFFKKKTFGIYSSGPNPLFHTY